MGDLDSILQDFSYLRSLEHKNQAPRKLSSKLYLPDPRWTNMYCFGSPLAALFMLSTTCLKPAARPCLNAYSIAQSVWSNVYCIVTTIIGLRCFQEFVFGDYGKSDPVAVALLELNNEVKDMSSELPPAALEKALTLKRKYFELQVALSEGTSHQYQAIVDANVWEADAANIQHLSSKLERLSSSSELDKSKRNVNLKVLLFVSALNV